MGAEREPQPPGGPRLSVFEAVSYFPLLRLFWGTRISAAAASFQSLRARASLRAALLRGRRAHTVGAFSTQPGDAPSAHGRHDGRPGFDDRCWHLDDVREMSDQVGGRCKKGYPQPESEVSHIDKQRRVCYRRGPRDVMVVPYNPWIQARPAALLPFFAARKKTHAHAHMDMHIRTRTRSIGKRLGKRPGKRLGGGRASDWAAAGQAMGKRLGKRGGASERASD